MDGQESRSFLETFGRTLGNLRLGLQAPLMEHAIELEYKKKQREQQEMLARQQAAFEAISKLERQEDLAADWQRDYGNKPEAAGLHGPVPVFGKADELRLYQQYGLAGLDPEKIATAEKARMMTDLFEQAKNNFADNPYIQAGLALGEAPKAIELEDGQYYDPNVQQGYLLGTTAKNKAETQKAEANALLEETRTKYANAFMNDPNINPIVRAEYARGGSVLKTEKAEIVGEDGKTYLADTLLMPGGERQLTKVKESGTGKLVEIPKEGAGGDSSGMTTDQKNIKYYSQLWGKTEAETAEILKSKSLFSDAGFIEDRLAKNTQGLYGNRNSDKEVLTATFDDFVRARHGSYFPDYFKDEINRSRTMKDKEKEELIAQIDSYNQKVSEMMLAKKTITPEVTPVVQEPIAQPLTPPIVPAMPASAGVPAGEPEPVTLPSIPAPPAIPSPGPVPQPPAPIPEAPPVPDFVTMAETVLSNNSPVEINAALKKQGFDLSPQAMGAMAIDAINRGVSVEDIQQLYQLMGIEWTPSA